jgi:alkanesulfonate monooxygenase SsuD/methylene tetrahydromethanopterin reductase-like flavin-dependent oxidoreductase (luciferase family)
MMFFASPERVVERIRAWQARGVTDFAFSTDFGGLDRASVERTRELFVREVMPLVRGSG